MLPHTGGRAPTAFEVGEDSDYTGWLRHCMRSIVDAMTSPASPPYPVCVVVEPALLRSAMCAVLSNDPRFDVVMCEAADDVTALAADKGARLVLASAPAPTADSARIPQPRNGGDVVAIVDGEVRSTTYAGLPDLCDWLAEQLPQSA